MKDKKVASILKEIALNQSLKDDEKNDLRYILAHILGSEKAKLILLMDKELTSLQFQAWEQAFHSLIAEQVPVHYIINRKNFMGLDFFVDERVLIPRFDTEILIEETLREINRLYEEGLEEPLRILELCTGSGAIPISIMHHTKKFPQIQIKALDISAPALQVAEINKKNLLTIEEQKRLHFIQSDLFDKVPLPTTNETFHLILANPPYVTKEEYATLEGKVKKEPINALVAKNQGLYFYDRILEDAKKYLKEGGKIIFEIGSLQGPALQKISKEKGYKECIILPDYAGLSRIAVIT